MTVIWVNLSLRIDIYQIDLEAVRNPTPKGGGAEIAHLTRLSTSCTTLEARVQDLPGGA